MAFRLISRLSPFTNRMNSPRAASSAPSSGSGGSLMVKHDRANRRFTVTPGSGADSDCAFLKYEFTGEKEVDLMSTFVPEMFRGHGVAALLSQAAMDFVAEEDLKARVSCWYIKKYIDEHPQQEFRDLLIS
ncbi:unnamed protein product [Ophioblennius macclurei]